MSKKTNHSNSNAKSDNQNMDISKKQFAKKLLSRLAEQGREDQHDPAKAVRSDSEAQISEALSALHSEPLSVFVLEVISDPAVRQTISQYVKPPHAQETICRIKQLQHAGAVAQYWSEANGQDKEALYVATLIRGIQELMAPLIVQQSCTPSEQMFSIVRSALHRLDAEAPQQAWLVRMALGWGNEDEVDHIYIPRVRRLVIRGLATVGPISAPGLLN